jgi:hypothetical protein
MYSNPGPEPASFDAIEDRYLEIKRCSNAGLLWWDPLLRSSETLPFYNQVPTNKAGTYQFSVYYCYYTFSVFIFYLASPSVVNACQ